MSLHGRKLTISGISITRRRLRRDVIRILTSVQSEFEGEIEKKGLLNGLPFEWIDLAIRFGDVDAPDPLIGPISPAEKFIEVAIEMDSQEFPRMDAEQVEEAVRNACRNALRGLFHEFKISY